MTIEELYRTYVEQEGYSMFENGAGHYDSHYDISHCQEYIDEP